MRNESQDCMSSIRKQSRFTLSDAVKTARFPAILSPLQWQIRKVILAPNFFAGMRFYKTRTLEQLSDSSHTHEWIYEYFLYRYRFRTSRIVHSHSRWFKRENRGFGEPAFHAFWTQLFREYRPVKCLEIGVYRGQTLSLWEILSREFRLGSTCYGLSPLSEAGDSASDYPSLDYLEDVRRNFKFWGLDTPRLVRQFSNSSQGRSFIGSQRWDLIYIDGGHEYETVLSDYQTALAALRHGGLLVLDDSSLFDVPLSYKGSFAGHEGPSRVCNENAKHDMTHLIRVGHLNTFLKK